MLEASEATSASQFIDVAQEVRRELGRAETRTTLGSLMPLYCSVRALEAAASRLDAPLSPNEAGTVLSIVEDVDAFISVDPAGRDALRKFAGRLRGIRSRLGAVQTA